MCFSLQQNSCEMESSLSPIIMNLSNTRYWKHMGGIDNITSNSIENYSECRETFRSFGTVLIHGTSRAEKCKRNECGTLVISLFLHVAVNVFKVGIRGSQCDKIRHRFVQLPYDWCTHFSSNCYRSITNKFETCS